MARSGSVRRIVSIEGRLLYRLKNIGDSLFNRGTPTAEVAGEVEFLLAEIVVLRRELRHGRVHRRSATRRHLLRVDRLHREVGRLADRLPEDRISRQDLDRLMLLVLRVSGRIAADMATKSGRAPRRRR